MTLPQLVHTVRVSLRDHGTTLLILDDNTRLKMHREADQDALDLLRSLMSMHVTLVLIGVGIPQSGLLGAGDRQSANAAGIVPAPRRSTAYNNEAATQTERRFDLVSLDPFRYDTPDDMTAWVAHLAGIEGQLRLFDAAPGMLSTGPMPEYLFARTAGIVGLLERLIEDGCAHAIETGTEQLTPAVLEAVDITLSHTPGRDRTARELPTVPARTAGTGARRRARNTVFDDRGEAAEPAAAP
jgi:hypothetical protein